MAAEEKERLAKLAAEIAEKLRQEKIRADMKIAAARKALEEKIAAEEKDAAAQALLDAEKAE